MPSVLQCDQEKQLLSGNCEKKVDAIEFKTQKEGRGRQSRFYYLNFSAELETKQAIATQKMFRK
jgi:hypothetical protein